MKKITKIVCMGDSLTEGWGIGKKDCWCTLLAQELEIEIINSGISGDTTSGMLARFKHMVLDHNPSHVIITGGTNDLFCHLTDEQIISNILAMTRYAKHHNVIAIIGIPTPYFYEESDEEEAWLYNSKSFIKRIEVFQNRLKAFAVEDELDFIDFALNMTQDLFLEDGLHPNEKGHLVMKENAKLLLMGLV